MISKSGVIYTRLTDIDSVVKVLIGTLEYVESYSELWESYLCNCTEYEAWKRVFEIMVSHFEEFEEC